jgi:hypothetical protein
MCSWDIISDLIDYTVEEYPDIDIRRSKKKFRQRVYEKIIVDQVVNHCCERIFNDPIDIVEDYELVYEYLNGIYRNDIYKIQLRVIRKILIFLRRRHSRYG